MDISEYDIKLSEGGQVQLLNSGSASHESTYPVSLACLS